MSARTPALGALLAALAVAASGQPAANLLLNSNFDFHCFDNSRSASARVYSAGYVACWDSDAYGDVTVTTAPHVDAVKTAVYTRNLVAIKPGKRLYQVIFLPDIGVRHGEQVSLLVYGQQKSPDSLRASVHVLKIDSQTGTWKPKDFGMGDTREFPRHSRGELVKANSYTGTSGAETAFRLALEGCEVPGAVVQKNESSDEQINSIALLVEFVNASAQDDVWVYAPCLVKGAQALSGLPELRPVPTYYRGIPRTIRKLWRGGPLHILVMGSSIDRGSANPPMYLYDEDPAAPTFKQPLSERDFDGSLVGRPDLTDTFGWWQHYFDWAGRLRVELMRKFNYTPDKLCLNFMARDGSSISEAMTGLAEYCSLSLPPAPDANGQKAGKTWQELYPGLFERPQGPGPDLVLFGSGANIKTDQPDEGAIFEAAIRWVQARYPDCEFLFCMWQRDRSYTENPGHLMELALAYQIPFIDLGDRMDQLALWSNRFALCPADGHPQAAGHTIWFKTVEQAFEVADPIASGVAQRRLPQRLDAYSYGWEGEIRAYDAQSPRLRRNMMILDDVQVTCWASALDGDPPVALVDGEKKRTPRVSAARDLRNASFACGRLSLGDRHVLELVGEKSTIAAADCRICPNRQFISADSPRWQPEGRAAEPFASEWGAPYGDRQVRLKAGEFLETEVVGTDLSVAFVEAPDGGALKVTVDGQERLALPANVPFTDSTGKQFFIEDRRGVRGLGYGMHHVRIEVTEGTVGVLGLFVYDARSNRDNERHLAGLAAPGETITFTPPFGARPVVMCAGGLTCDPADVTPSQARFGGNQAGSYQVIGE
jgi:hypothetical protein